MNNAFPLKLSPLKNSECLTSRSGNRVLWLFNAPLALIAVAIIVSCSSPLPNLPPPNSTGTVLPGKVVWHDLVTPDMDKAKVFYTGLFGWTFEDITRGYSIAKNNGQIIAGIAEIGLSGRPSHWLLHVSVIDMDHTLSYVKSAGGSLVLKPFDLAGRGRVALVKDPQGAAFGIVQSSHGDPTDRKPIVNGWLWNEVWTGDVHGAIEFYRQIADYRVAERTTDGNTYRYLEYNGRPRVGFLKKPDAQIDNTWVAYIRVDDIGTVLNKVEPLGGKILVPPQPAIRNGSVAVITDPDGAGFIVQEWHK
ncbi:MAG: VOC family protein [Thermodesulfobacteriota bacterium]|nr:VOC family protein [Thermodesulfobacteriota bacterium]